MKYFTRDLYRRCQSTDDDVSDVASEEWEQANQRYEQHLRAIEPRLPAHVREFNSLLLHDAMVQSISRQGGHLLLVLHKDIPPHDLVFLDYELDGDPVIEPFTDSPRDWSKPTDFNFDEFDVLDAGDRTVYTESIVFGNGWVLHLRFRDVRASLAQPLYPVVVGSNIGTPTFLPTA